VAQYGVLQLVVTVVGYPCNPDKFVGLPQIFNGKPGRHPEIGYAAHVRCCRAKQLSYELAFNLTSYLHREQDYVPWAAFFDVVGFIAGMLSTSDAYGPLQVTRGSGSEPNHRIHAATVHVSLGLYFFQSGQESKVLTPFQARSRDVS